jgi:hypothetical protein
MLSKYQRKRLQQLEAQSAAKDIVRLRPILAQIKSFKADYKLVSAIIKRILDKLYFSEI